MEKAEASEFCNDYYTVVPSFMQTFMRTWSNLYEDTFLNHHQAGLLMFIDGKKRCKMSELAAELSLSPGAITQMVDSLVLQGFIERVDDEKDRRVVLVKLTEKAQNLINRVKRRRQMLLNEILSSLSRDEALTLITLISKLEQTLREIDLKDIIRRADSTDHPLTEQEDECFVD